jgi:hypothetical protein
MSPWPPVRDGVITVLRAIVTAPRRLARWLAAHPAHALTLVWLGGMGTFVGLPGARGIAASLAAERDRLAMERAKDQARIADEVQRFLEKRPNPDAGRDTLPATAPEGEVVELMDIDEMEAARGGSDEAAREAIAGLQEPFEGEGEAGEPRAAAAKVPMETVTIKGKDGETVTIRMKQGGFAGWIARNRKYRKRRLGDKETLEIMAEVTHGVGTKVNVNPNGPMGSLAAIAAIRGSAQAEAEETGADKAELTATPESSVPGEAPAMGGTRPGQARPQRPAPGVAVVSGAVAAAGQGSPPASPAVGLAPAAAAAGASGTGGVEGPLSSFGELEIELLGLAAAIGIASPVETAAEATTARAAANREALDRLVALLGPVAERHRVGLDRRPDHVALRWPAPVPPHRESPATLAAFADHLAVALATVPGSRVEVQLDAARPVAGKRGRSEASPTDKQRLATWQAVLRAHRLPDARVEIAAPAADKPAAAVWHEDEAATVIRIFPAKPEAKGAN